MSPKNKPCHQNGSPRNNFVTKAHHPEQIPSPKLNTQNKPCHENTAPRTNLVTKVSLSLAISCSSSLFSSSVSCCSTKSLGNWQQSYSALLLRILPSPPYSYRLPNLSREGSINYPHHKFGFAPFSMFNVLMSDHMATLLAIPPYSLSSSIRLSITLLLRLAHNL